MNQKYVDEAWVKWNKVVFRHLPNDMPEFMQCSEKRIKNIAMLLENQFLCFNIEESFDEWERLVVRSFAYAWNLEHVEFEALAGPATLEPPAISKMRILQVPFPQDDLEELAKEIAIEIDSEIVRDLHKGKERYPQGFKYFYGAYIPFRIRHEFDPDTRVHQRKLVTQYAKKLVPSERVAEEFNI